KERVLQLMLTAALLAVLLSCEFFIYYLVIFQYSWPEMKIRKEGGAPSRLMDDLGRCCQAFSPPPHVQLSVVAGHHDNWLPLSDEDIQNKMTLERFQL
ncbi:hypothetical protein EI555_008545, partial [Monodon monoceros]